MPEKLVALLYMSDMSPELDDIDLMHIDYELTKNNAYYNTSGILIFHQRQFFHFLEGEEAVVDNRFARLQRDNRHRNVRMVLKMAVARRLFGTWNATSSTLAEAKAYIAANLAMESRFSPLKDFIGFFRDTANDDGRPGGRWMPESEFIQPASSTSGMAASSIFV